MISKKMEQMVANSSAIRAMFEEGNKMAEKYGAENVYDFSLGNPNVPAPKAVKEQSFPFWSQRILYVCTATQTAMPGMRM